MRAVARLCGARVTGDALGSTYLEFTPTHLVAAGDYVCDVAEARLGGSAGAATLAVQSVLPPLALAAGRSRVTVHGGTHVPWSPSADYARDVWLSALAAMGVDAEIELVRFGWFPVGRGAVRAVVAGRDGRPLRPLVRRGRGALQGIRGRAVAANLPAHIPERMAGRARAILADAGLGSDIRAESVTAACPGAGIF